MRCERCGNVEAVVPGSVVCLLNDLPAILCVRCHRDFQRHAESQPVFQAWLNAAQAKDWAWAQAHTDSGCTEMGKSEFIGVLRSLYEAKVAARPMVLEWLANKE